MPNFVEKNRSKSRSMGLPVLHCPAEVMHIDFYFRAVYHRNWHAILHQAAEFHPNETTYCGK